MIAPSRIRFALVLFLVSSAAVSAEELPRTALEAAGMAALHTVVPIAAGVLAANAEMTPLNEAGGLLVAYGLLVGPSMGNVHLRDWTGATVGAAVRLTGALMGVVGIGIGLGCALGGADSDGEGGRSVCDDGTVPLGLLLGGAGVYLGGTIWNLSRLSDAADRYNERFANASGPRISLAPTWRRDAQALGMRLTLRY